VRHGTINGSKPILRSRAAVSLAPGSGRVIRTVKIKARKNLLF
jgi:hypothetical protein